MHRKVFACLFFVLVSVFSLTAQDSEWYWNQPISKIDFSGLDNVRKSDLQGITSAFIDKPFTEDTYNEILDRLYALDYFEDITPYAKHDTKDETKVLLVFEVVERPVIKSVLFSGNKKVRNGELREQIKIKASDIFIEAKVLVDERNIRNYYLQKGYTTSSVSHTIEERDGEIVVTYNITEGNSSVIREINFSGNTIASSRALKNKISLKELGLFKDGAYQPSTLEQDKQTIAKYYHERGYADATVLDVKIDITPNEEKQRDELSILFIIQEGVQYTYSGIRISGNEVFTKEELLKNQKLKSGSVYNETKFQEDLTSITNVYYENGYMSNEFYPVPVKDADRHEISYDFTIREHTRSHVENIIVKGNSKTKDYVITREIPITPGDTFSNDKIINGMRNLMNLRYFSNVVPEVQQGAEANLVDLVFSVEEQSTSSIQFGLTFTGTVDPGTLPISFLLKVENSNMWGEGRTLSAGVNGSNTNQSIDFSYSQNWIGSLPIAFGISLSLGHSITNGFTNFWTPQLELVQDRFTMSYDDWNATLSTNLARRWTPNYAIFTLTGGLSTTLQRNVYNESISVPVDTGISLYANRWGISNSVYGQFSLDNRDINYDPSKGWFMSQRFSWHGLIPYYEKEFFLKSDTKLEGYLKLFDLPVSEKWSFKMVFAAYTGITTILPCAEVSDGNKAYIDGMINARGWTDVYKETKGMFMLSNRLELRVPLVPGILGIDGFWDAATVKPRIQDISNISMNDFYFSFGPGIRFLLPQLPLHLVFAWRYRVIDGVPQFAKSPFQFVLSFNIVNN